MARLLVLAVLVAVFTASPARAELPAGTFTMQAENDRIANTDRHYTHGTRLTWVVLPSYNCPIWFEIFNDDVEVLGWQGSDIPTRMY